MHAQSCLPQVQVQAKSLSPGGSWGCTVFHSAPQANARRRLLLARSPSHPAALTPPPPSPTPRLTALSPPPQAPNGNATRLYRFVFTGTDGVWETASSNARPRFYDANEDTSTSSRSKKSYHLEVEAGDIDAHVDQEMNYVMDVKQRRVTFHAGGAIWALKFASDEAARAFAEELNDAAFYNQYGVDCDDDGRAKVMEDYSGVLFSKDPQRAFEPMDVDDGDVDTRAAEAATPDRLREFKTKETEGDEDMIMGIVMGAGVCGAGACKWGRGGCTAREPMLRLLDACLCMHVCASSSM